MSKSEGKTEHHHVRILEDGRAFFSDDFPELTDQVVIDFTEPLDAKEIFMFLDEGLPEGIWNLVKRVMLNLSTKEDSDD